MLILISEKGFFVVEYGQEPSHPPFSCGEPLERSDVNLNIKKESLRGNNDIPNLYVVV